MAASFPDLLPLLVLGSSGLQIAALGGDRELTWSNTNA